MRCSRPRGSQIGAVVSDQSSVLAHGREQLEQRQKELQQVHIVPVPLDAGDLEARLSLTCGICHGWVCFSAFAFSSSAC